MAKTDSSQCGALVVVYARHPVVAVVVVQLWTPDLASGSRVQYRMLRLQWGAPYAAEHCPVYYCCSTGQQAVIENRSGLVAAAGVVVPALAAAASPVMLAADGLSRPVAAAGNESHCQKEGDSSFYLQTNVRSKKHVMCF